MKKVELAKTGEMVSEYALGSMLMGSRIGVDESFEILDDYYNRGGNFIDTANNYAWWIGIGEFSGVESENILGQWFETRQNRGEIFLATKVGARQRDHMAIRGDDGIPRWDEIADNLEGASRDVILKSVSNSLNRLKTDYIDLLYIHVDDRVTDLKETLETLDMLVKDGTIRYIGYSNIQTWRLEKVFNICKTYNYTLPIVIQMEYSYISPAKYGPYELCIHAKEDFFDWMKSKDGAVNLIAYSPLMKGVFCNREKRETYLQQDDYNSALVRSRLTKVEKLSKTNNIHPNLLVLKWMTSREFPIIPIIGFSSYNQYLENIGVTECNIESSVIDQL